MNTHINMYTLCLLSTIKTKWTTGQTTHTYTYRHRTQHSNTDGQCPFNDTLYMKFINMTI